MSDVGKFLRELNYQLDLNGWDKTKFTSWLAWCRNVLDDIPRFPPLSVNLTAGLILITLSKPSSTSLTTDDVVVTGNAISLYCLIPNGKNKARATSFLKLRISFNGLRSARSHWRSFAHDGRVICLAGDGSLQLNIQELQTVAHYGLPMKIVVLNNNGYLSIRNSQKNFFGNNGG